MTLKLNGSSSGSTSIDAPASGADTSFKFPGADGTAGQVLKTDASGNLGWATDQGGKILQVVESTSSTTVTTSGGTEADLLTLSITPSSSSSDC